jgi:hypothetical protein
MDRSTDRSTPPSLQPLVEPPAPLPLDPLPLDIDEDPADESIYSMGYRTRIGVVVRDVTAVQTPEGQPPPGGAEPLPAVPSPRS